MVLEPTEAGPSSLSLGPSQREAALKQTQRNPGQGHRTKSRGARHISTAPCHRTATLEAEGASPGSTSRGACLPVHPLSGGSGLELLPLDTLCLGPCPARPGPPRYPVTAERSPPQAPVLSWGRALAVCHSGHRLKVPLGQGGGGVGAGIWVPPEEARGDKEEALRPGWTG